MASPPGQTVDRPGLVDHVLNRADYTVTGSTNPAYTDDRMAREGERWVESSGFPNQVECRQIERAIGDVIDRRHKEWKDVCLKLSTKIATTVNNYKTQAVLSTCTLG